MESDLGPATLWGILESEPTPSNHEAKRSGEEHVVDEADVTLKGQPSIEPAFLEDLSMVAGEETERATEHFHSALSGSILEANLERKPVSAYFSYYSPEDDELVESDVDLLSPSSGASGETLVDAPEQVASPQALRAAGSELEKHVHQLKKSPSNEQALQRLKPRESVDEDGQPILPLCCKKIKSEWEHTIKIIEGSYETEIANAVEDFEEEKSRLQAEHGETLEDLRNNHKADMTDLEQKYAKALRESVDKSKDVRDLRKDLKTNSESIKANEDLARSQADTIRKLQDEVASQKISMKNLQTTHNNTVQNLKAQHLTATSELEEALQAKSEESSEMAQLAEKCHLETFMLQAQHASICQGVSCTQQIEELEAKLGNQEYFFYQKWNNQQHELQLAKSELQQSTTDLLVANQERDEANFNFKESDNERKVTGEKLKQAKKLLLADDAKAVSAHILQECADEMENMMAQNCERIGEIQNLYREREVVLKSHENQVIASNVHIDELVIDISKLLQAHDELKKEYTTLYAQYQHLEQTNTSTQIRNNNLQIANNDLAIVNFNLKNSNEALKREKQGLGVHSDSPQVESSKNAKLGTGAETLAAKKPSLQDQIDEAARLEQEALAEKANRQMISEPVADNSNKATRQTEKAVQACKATPAFSAWKSFQVTCIDQDNDHDIALNAAPTDQLRTDSTRAETRDGETTASTSASSSQHVINITQITAQEPQEASRDVHQAENQFIKPKEENKSMDHIIKTPNNTNIKEPDAAQPATPLKNKTNTKTKATTAAQTKSTAAAMADTSPQGLSRKAKRALKKQRG